MDFGRQRDPYEDAFRKIQNNFNDIYKRVNSLEQLQTRSVRRESPVADHVRDLEISNQSYVQIVMLVGYGSFFALWTNTVDKMSAWLFASTGLLISISISFFVVFELLKQFSASDAGVSAEEKVGFGKPIDGLSWVDASKNALKNVNRYWRFFFCVSALTGVTAGFSLLFWFMWITVRAAFPA